MRKIYADFDAGVHVFTAAESDVLSERRRQQVEEGFSTLSDDCNNINGTMTKAAITYAFGAFVSAYRPEEIQENWFRLDFMRTWWPWSRRWWKPGPARRMLVKAAALIIAEIERIDRAAEREEKQA